MAVFAAEPTNLVMSTSDGHTLFEDANTDTRRAGENHGIGETVSLARPPP